jgi:hypothetical protein
MLTVRKYIILMPLLILLISGCGGGGVGDLVPFTGGGGGGPIPTDNSASLSWGTPTTYTNGDPFTDLAGYKIYYGTTPGSYTEMLDVGNVNQYTVTNLSSGSTYYFVITAYNTSQVESDFSTEVSKTFT